MKNVYRKLCNVSNCLLDALLNEWLKNNLNKISKAEKYSPSGRSRANKETIDFVPANVVEEPKRCISRCS